MSEIRVERIGQEVDRLRTKYGISLKELAAALDVPVEAIWQLEQQIDHVPDATLLAKVASHLKAMGASEQDMTLLNAEIPRLKKRPPSEPVVAGGNLLVAIGAIASISETSARHEQIEETTKHKS